MDFGKNKVSHHDKWCEHEVIACGDLIGIGVEDFVEEICVAP